MKILAILILLILVVLVVYAVAQWVTARRETRQEALRRNAEWELDEASDGTYATIFLTHPIERPFFIGSTPIGGDDFDYEIEQLRSEGESKLVALNNRPKRLKR